jgi:hypothetical protein
MAVSEQAPFLSGLLQAMFGAFLTLQRPRRQNRLPDFSSYPNARTC